jgi:hypothetical protein
VSLKDNQVRLEKSDEQMIDIAIDNRSAADARVVRELGEHADKEPFMLVSP